MTDTPPITVNATATSDQWSALARQIVLVLGPLAGFAGANHMTGLSNGLNLATAITGPALAIVSLIYGQWKTRDSANKLAVLANKLPDNVAKTV